MKRYIALLLVVMLLLTACGTTQPPADGTTPSTSATTGSTEPDGTEATQGDTTAATENVTQPSADGTGGTEPSTKPTDGSSTDGTGQPTTQPTQPTQQPTQPPTQPPQPTEGTKPSDPAPTVNLSLDKTTISLEVGKTATITATYSGASGKPAWSSTDTSVATVDSNGKVTAKKAGTAYITASYGGKNAQCAVTVTNPAPSVGTLTINTPNNTVVKVGSTLKLDYSYTGKGDLTFKSMDTDILTVNNSGLITGKAAGAAQVRVYHGDTQLGSVRIKVEKSGGSETGPAAEKIVLDGTTAPWMGVAGNYMTFTAHAKTSGSNQKVTATSSNTSVATVSLQSTSGSNWCTFKVSFKSGGSATITITSEDGKASTSYTVNVSGGYSCNPGGGQLTPEQFVSAANGVMQANGATISTGAGYRVLTLDASKLTWSNARSFGEGWVREFWPNGITRMGLSYEGVNDEGKHVFHIHA